MKRFLIFVLIGFVAGFIVVSLGLFEEKDYGLVGINNDIEYIESEVVFTDVTEEAGLMYTQHTNNNPNRSSEYIRSILPNLFSGGAAASDYDNDGYVDLYVTRLDDRDILFRNLGNGEFEDVSYEVGLNLNIKSNGAGFADFDNDGWKDLYVTTVDENRFYLFMNKIDGNGKFVEEAKERNADIYNEGLIHQGFSVSFGDFDNDGFIDIHTTEWQRHNSINPQMGRLLHNIGKNNPGYFEDVTNEIGVRMNSYQGYGDVSFASTFADFNDDGWQDLSVVADFGNSRLFLNENGNNFIDITRPAGLGKDEFGMGSAVGDINNDGLLDWFVSSIYCEGKDCFDNMIGNKLYINKRNDNEKGEYLEMGINFSDETEKYGVENGGWGWGASFIDINNDGLLDLVQTNSMNEKIMGDHDFSEEKTRLWINTGSKMKLVEDFGLDEKGGWRGLLVFDYDNDGDQDIFIVKNKGEPVLYRNDFGNENNWLRLRLIGKESNKNGIGAKITLTTENKRIIRTIQGGSNYLGQNEAIAHFGLGNDKKADKIVINWPGGKKQILKNIESNQLLVVEEKNKFGFGDLVG